MSNRYIPVPVPTSWLSRLFGGGATSAGGAGAYVPGRPGLAAQGREWISVPKVIGLAAAAILLRQYMKTPAAKVNRAVTMECQEKYCPTSYMIFVDKAKATLMKDQSEGAGLSSAPPCSLKVPYERVKRDLMREVEQSPGVNLVAGKMPGTELGAVALWDRSHLGGQKPDFYD